MLARLNIELLVEQVSVADKLDSTVVAYLAKIGNVAETVRRADLLGQIVVII